MLKCSHCGRPVFTTSLRCRLCKKKQPLFYVLTGFGGTISLWAAVKLLEFVFSP
jgi:hypothetical protein